MSNPRQQLSQAFDPILTPTETLRRRLRAVTSGPGTRGRQTEMARAMGMSPQQLNNFKNGSRPIGLDYAATLDKLISTYENP